ncbi:MAG TPA: hypothetical protein V6D12_13995 [Candidatus Obscuribacterales bacterium]
MYGQTVKVGRFEVWVPGVPEMKESEWIKRAKEILINEIEKA